MAKYKITIDTKKLESAFAGGTAAQGKLSGPWMGVVLEVPPTLIAPPHAMQGHWIEPRSGRQLHIAADGTVAFRAANEAKPTCHRWVLVDICFSLNAGFLVYNNKPLTDTVETYCRKGLDELRLMAWLNKNGK